MRRDVGIAPYRVPTNQAHKRLCLRAEPFSCLFRKIDGDRLRIRIRIVAGEDGLVLFSSKGILEDKL